MKRLLTLLIISSTAHCAFSQDSTANEGPWKRGGIAGLNFSQTYLDNWQGGGQNAINGTVILNLFANYSKDKISWDNTFDAAYGLTRLGKVGQLQKTDDRVEINSKFGYQIPVKKMYWAVLGTFRTQWDNGYDYSVSPSPLISDPFSPAYVLIGTGIDYKPSDAFSAYLSPATAKITIVDNQRLADAGAFGVEAAEYDSITGALITPGQTMRYEVGAYLKLAYSKEIVKNVQLNTKADFFMNYLENVGNIDVNWETLIAMKINEYLSASISTHLIYDDDIKIAVDNNDDGIIDAVGPRVQFKEVFSLGIQYQF
ncbi:MAG: DUF3078 domain-containing protein [Flavobacteriales bacterium]